jgi:ATP/maltotriose-dependent transcriptional regulator MalT
MARNRVGRKSAIHLVGGSSNRLRHHQLPDESAVISSEVILKGRRYRLVPLDEASASHHEASVATLLTGRELQIVTLVAEGRVNKQIASDLRISEWTVSTHLRRIFAKLGVDTRAAMVSRCAQSLASRGR